MISEVADGGFWQPPEREPDIVELFAGCGEQEIGLVSTSIDSAMQLDTRLAIAPLDIMTGCQTIGAEIF